MSRIVGSIFVLIILLTMASRVDSGRDWRFRVSFNVTSDTHKYLIIGHFKQYFQNVSDVEMAHTNPKYTIHVTHVFRHDDRLHEMAFALSRSFDLHASWKVPKIPMNRPLNPDEFDKARDETDKAKIFMYNEKYGFFQDLCVFSGGNLQTVCDGISDRVDKEYFDQYRH